MHKSLLIEVFNLLAIILIGTVPFLSIRQLAKASIILITLQILIAFSMVILIFSKGTLTFQYPGSIITGILTFKADYLSAWFIGLISFTFLTGTFWGLKYLEKYQQYVSKLKIHVIAYVLVYTSLIDLCLIQNTLLFLVAWEIMAVGSFLVIIFEWEKKDTLKAGINFLIQSHIGIILLTLAFIWVKIKTGSFDFSAITTYTSIHPALGTALFLLFFTGFAIKAGFVPFHTWLPLAHPAAPAHISGIMSGVIIKIGIFGILRMITLIETQYTMAGYFVLGLSVITGIYGVMLAIIQHNLKRLLAYHSIENIGIIGIGIGAGCLGMGMGNSTLLLLGFSGALLHTLNHSLFKSLLFFTSGNIYQATHTMNIESLGGMIKKLPHTAALFLMASLAICGLPPFNGFVSEFLIYKGLFSELKASQFMFTLSMLFSFFGLVLIGGLAMICFTKAFGVVFLGNTRGSVYIKTVECPMNTIPLYAIALVMLAIGIFPFLFIHPLVQTIDLFVKGNLSIAGDTIHNNLECILPAGLTSLGLIITVLTILLLRKMLTTNKPIKEYETWGCGFPGNIPKAQYTASSFIHTYSKLAEPVLLVKKEKKVARVLYPSEIKQTTHPFDKLEFLFIDKPLSWYRWVINQFTFLQNGNLQYYIFYGLIFILMILIFPLLVSKLTAFMNFFNQL